MPEENPGKTHERDPFSPEEVERRREIVRREMHVKIDFDAGRATLEATPGGVMFLPRIGVGAWPSGPDLGLSDDDILEAVARLGAPKE